MRPDWKSKLGCQNVIHVLVSLTYSTIAERQLNELMFAFSFIFLSLSIHSVCYCCCCYCCYGWCCCCCCWKFRMSNRSLSLLRSHIPIETQHSTAQCDFSSFHPAYYCILRLCIYCFCVHYAVQYETFVRSVHIVCCTQCSNVHGRFLYVSATAAPYKTGTLSFYHVSWQRFLQQ